MNAAPEMRRRQHRIQRSFDRAGRIREEVSNTSERLVGFRVEDMQSVQARNDWSSPNDCGARTRLRDRRGCQRYFGHPLAVALRISRNGLLGRACLIGRIEQEHGPKACAPTARQLEILALHE